MTHTELYEIVKDHPDVWSKVMEWDDPYWMDKEPPASYVSPAGAEAMLLGLGVAWLVEHKREPIMSKWKHGFGCWFPVSDGLCSDNDAAKSLLAAVYAAIAEVKQAAK